MRLLPGGIWGGPGWHGCFEQESGNKVWLRKYGLKVFSPIAKNFPYSDFDDFGACPTDQEKHLGHDMMLVGTPVIAVESEGERCGWNQYGGWRIGRRSFDMRITITPICARTTRISRI